MYGVRKALSKAKAVGRKLARNRHDTPAPEPYAHGLFVLYPPPELLTDQRCFSLDIVAVHGLNGKARETWKDEKTDTLWLEDFLPEAIPNARIMTFGYDSSLLLSNSKGRIEDFARDLLNRLWVTRHGQEASKRPIVFIAHSLGGIVVKKALILAHENDHYFGNILSSTIGIMFMGTPHHGSKIADWTSFLRSLIHITSGTQLIRADLVKELCTHSETLHDISESFLPRSIGLNIMSFIELQIERPLTALVVPNKSARLNLPNEMVFPVNTHHRNICRYSSKNDQTYVLVEGSLKSLVHTGTDSSAPTIFNKYSVFENREHTQTMLAVAESAQEQHYPSPGDGLGKNQVLSISDNLRKHSPDGNSAKDVPIALADATWGQETFKVRLFGLEKYKFDSEEYMFDLEEYKFDSEEKRGEEFITLDVSGDTDLSDFTTMCRNLITKGPFGFTFEGFKFPGRSSPITNLWKDVFTVPVQVISDRPSYKKSPGYGINVEQSIADFCSRAFPNPISAKLREYPQQMQSSIGMSQSVIVGKEDCPEVHISFMRTIRVKGDENKYTPPPGLGSFPLFDTSLYKNKLPASVAAKGGLFFPMHEREAMWMSFDCERSSKFAVRPFLGGVNGITGDNILSDGSKSDSSINPACQDYIVVPTQTRLDGISSRHGVVKQFVATGLSAAEQKREPRTSNSSPATSEGDVQGPDLIIGEGRTIEWQMTGKDEIGGIQLQIIPEFETDRIFAGNLKDVCPIDVGGRLESYCPVPPDATRYDILNTPRQLGLQVGDTIHVKVLHKPPSNRGRPKVIRDLVAEAPKPPGYSYDIELEVYGIYGGYDCPGLVLCSSDHFDYRPYIKVMFGGVNVFNGRSHGRELKTILYERTGILPHLQAYKVDEFVFPDGYISSIVEEIPHSHDRSELILELVVRPHPQPTLGIGAGGSIIQEIHPDNSDPRLWDVASSKILHIQIVNSDVFGSIVEPQPSEGLMDFMTGQEREYMDPKGVFDGIISVDEPEGTEIGDEVAEGTDDGLLIPVSPVTLLQVDQTIPQFKGHQGRLSSDTRRSARRR
ncbi:hypothetical protein F4811DRAFT_451374 [Daldinia bambusicola]|nr:hypothetical protein F4811DRAFT_451374 [Daldinia bambusicola]